MPLAWTDLAFGSPLRIQPLALFEWLQTRTAPVTITDMAEHFGWSSFHTLRVLSRLPVERL